MVLFPLVVSSYRNSNNEVLSSSSSSNEARFVGLLLLEVVKLVELVCNVSLVSTRDMSAVFISCIGRKPLSSILLLRWFIVLLLYVLFVSTFSCSLIYEMIPSVGGIFMWCLWVF